MTIRWQVRIARAFGLRVAVWYAVVFAFSSALVGVIAYQLLVQSLVRRDHELLRVKLAEYSERYESGGLPALSRALSAERASGDPDSVLVRLVAPNADVLLVSAPAGWPSFQFGAPAESTNRSSSTDSWLTVPSPSSQVVLELISRPLFDGTLIQVGRTTVGRDRLLADVRDLLGLLVAVVIAVGLAGGATLTYQALRPLRDLRDAVRTIARTGRFGARVQAARDGDLLDELGQVFNQMLGRIETLVDGMRGALDNVAHDLRTPIARLRARAEAALDPHASVETTRAALADCVEEADRVMALLSTLMDISEAETGTMRLALERISVHELAAETVALYEDAADERRIALSSQVPGDLAVRGDRQRLRQALANLVDNALKYTEPGGRIVIGGRGADAREVEIFVTDTGIGIAPEHLGRIWERLYRVDGSGSEPGLGLGLSLVRAIAIAHGGRADVVSEPARGSTFRLILPAA